MPAPTPVLWDTVPLSNAHDISYLMKRLDRTTLVDLVADLGIVAEGPVEDIIQYLAFSAPWDYRKTQKLREHYVLSLDASRLTGFLIEAPINYKFSDLTELMVRYKQRNRRDSQPDDDIKGLLDVVEKSEIISCKYRYKRDRVKSDLSILRDATIDTRFFVYDTGYKATVGRALFCVAIQPTASSDYGTLLDEFLLILKSIPGSRIQAFSLKSNGTSDDRYTCLSFADCESSNQFMINLLNNPTLDGATVRDVRTQHHFRWEGNLDLSAADIEESEGIEEDLDLHLSEIRITGAALHKTKTAIAAASGRKHAVRSLGIVYESAPKLYFTNVEFKLQQPRLEIQVEKIMQESALFSRAKLYDAELYWNTLWELWNTTVDRYLSAVL